MNKNSTPLVDEHLQAFSGMKEAGTDEFFYTRLKAKMENRETEQGWSFTLKPVWVIGTLVLFLAMNGFTLLQRSGTKETTVKTSNATVQDFAISYDQSISSY